MLNEVLNEIYKNNGTLNILIAGQTCSGKTTLANNLYEELSKMFNVTLIHQDDYFKDLDNIPRSRFGYLTDSINAFETREFIYDVNELLAEGKVLVPRYDVPSNKRIAKDKEITKGQINIFEGLHVINILKDLPNQFSIYLNTSPEICLERRVNRDTKLFNIDESRIREYFYDCILPVSKDYIWQQEKIADIVLKEGGEMKCRTKS